MRASGNDVTRLLVRLGEGDRTAESELIEIVFPQLRRLAGHYMRSERPDHTLQPTALVHEAYLRLVKIEDIDWKDRVHFFGLAAKLMRQILVDHARARKAAKRPQANISLDEELAYSNEKSSAVLALDEALSRLAMKDVRMGRVVELKFFGGLTFDQIGRVLEVSEKTAKRDWQLARAWLRKEMRKN
jgi:RNA polymerase sigma factor (TIGR02999 family)